MRDLTIIVIKNNVPKVVEVTDKVKDFIEKVYYEQEDEKQPMQSTTKTT